MVMRAWSDLSVYAYLIGAIDEYTTSVILVPNQSVFQNSYDYIRAS